MDTNADELLDQVLTQVEIEARIVDELERIRQIERRLHDEPAAERRFDEAERALIAGLDARSDKRVAGETDPEPILRLMRAAQTALLRHPTAASMVFGALVDEGRNYVATPDGQARAAAMGRDPVMNDLRRLWEATSLNVISDDPEQHDGGLPAGWIELILDTAASVDIDALVADMASEPGS